MARILLILLAIALSLADPAAAYEIVVVKNSRNEVTEKIQQIFFTEINRRIPLYGHKAIQPHRINDIVLSESGTEGLGKRSGTDGADLILAIGSAALKAAVKVPGVPVVHLLAANPELITEESSLVSGVRLAPSAHEQLAEVRRVLPSVRRIGLVYDPAISGKFIQELLHSGPDLEFVALDATKSSEVVALIPSLRGRVDLLWMLPDRTVSNQKTIQSYFLFSITNKLPLLTFSEKLLKQGATLAVTFDLVGVTRQAAELAVQRLSHDKGGARNVLVSPRAKTVVNYRVAEKLDIPIANKGELRD